MSKPTLRDIEVRVEKLLAIAEELKDACAEYLGHEETYVKGWEALEGGLYALTGNVKTFKQETEVFNEELFPYSDWTEEDEEALK